ncbi:hypothetical protein D910_11477 [Dendroctonus ponderosae]|uniref:Protein kinase domain-containing protein n=1 Tax=Dendroctonus ponderosae TaxID=77166 RepID=U4UVD0_DENPD|nr:hypothetical protein D910_11477 [Dendroctonus ponderosae]
MRKQLKKLRKLIGSLDGNVERTSRVSTEGKTPGERKNEPFFNIKKSKRRSRVLKAKLTKIKNMEIAERLSLKNGQIFSNQLKENVCNSAEFAPDINSLTSRIKLFNVRKEETLAVKESDETPESLSFFSKNDRKFYQIELENDNSLSMFDVHVAKEVEENGQMIDMLMTDDLECPTSSYSNEEQQNPISTSLKQFLQTQHDMQEKEETCFIPTFPEWKSKIYKLPFNDWSSFGDSMRVDKKKLKAAVQYMKNISVNYDNTANAIALDAALQVVDEYFKELLEIILARTKAGLDLSKIGKKSNYLEKHAISELQANFHHLISSIFSLAHSNLSEALRNIYQLESTLIHHSINGKTLLSDVCALEQVKIQYTTFSSEAESSFLIYVENVLNGFEDLREDIKITVVDGVATVLESASPNLYAKEMSGLRQAQQPKNRRKELQANAKTMEGAYHLMNSFEELIQEEDELVKSKVEAKISERVTKILTKQAESEQLKELEGSRWIEKIQQLHIMKQNQLLLGSDVKLCKNPDRNHVISQGGNFNIVTLGLGANNQPLAVKKIPSKHCVSNILKTVVKPLLGLRHKNILHYFVCTFEESDLIIATPLCEYNIGQYVQLLKDSPEKDVYDLSPMEIVRQFLTGLAFLHHQPEPIVHGNLKPSNIFVDIHGVVRLAEFGINKLIEAPETSLIWFSQECYKAYKATSKMNCSLASDIQVAGMLIYFIVSYGVHPFGHEISMILKNLEKATFRHPSSRDTQNQIFADLVSWMLMYEPNDRPQMTQVLSHVLFWSNDRRWRFILNCSGISTNGVPLAVSTSHLHSAIDETSTKEQIKGHWVSIARRKFPKIKFQSDDTVVGFLKFIKQFYETQILDEESLNELKNCVLNYFPAFPLTLYRILEATGLIKEYPFIAYTATESVLS